MCTRKPNEKVEEYLDKFKCYGRVKSSGSAKIPEEILDFMVLDRADVDETQGQEYIFYH